MHTTSSRADDERACLSCVYIDGKVPIAHNVVIIDSDAFNVLPSGEMRYACMRLRRCVIDVRPIECAMTALTHSASFPHFVS